jgi:tripartite-type tricarboxylate transporter receptor subunit TctC
MPLYADKKIKVLGMTSPERLPIAPDVPTLKEQGINIVNYGWWGVCAGANTPKPIIDKLNAHISEAVKSADYKSTMEKSGVIAISTPVSEFSKIWNETANEAGKMLKDLGIAQIDQ